MLYDKRWSKTDVAPAPWRKVLLDAADILERDGWCKHKLFDGDRSCALGAMRRAEARAWPSVSLATAIDAQTKLEAFVGRMHASIWNDTRDTAEEVIATMREVARS